MAAICLHNYLQQTENSAYCPTGFVDSYDGNGQIKNGEWRRLVTPDGALPSISKVRGSRYTEDAIQLRDALKTYVNSEKGSLPWQLNHVRKTGKNEE